ncbi:lytic transglycosylase domain-containing protein [Dickeya dianthicola]|uniref:lytic transglycosylase domain-containing protein n=1 Tax=Dickeya dianthicola TaxID=204039 RepID=UPI0003A00DA0|nr:lytic transglycosylase domain-containing protein [Dickeya dianthicola]MCI4031498.1 lytic transglycosylase domain-containing protein [Dickeya dianthicola]MCI4174576.1 lytic transglycosylase domain-containing protein [Dickeya dianthicola]MCI4179564.1 lytic transglycosylase domain-containing protein [Dickeya dianthicola]MCI4180329.1 lytic transglycosylase domain-containing protein [Dickeya dianthicola]MCI4194072.1 lytic transglycosylase domain-containing protein [Dickeya dianthicola]
MLRLPIFLLLILLCPRAGAFCFDAAGAKYHIDPLLIRSIATGESSLRPEITNVNRDKKTGRALSTDYGLMQVNSSHIPALIAQGYIRSPQDLLTRPCLNVQIGTWILAKHFQVCGISWNCLGSYNAGFRQDRHETRESYANRIYAIYRRLLLKERGIKL